MKKIYILSVILLFFAACMDEEVVKLPDSAAPGLNFTIEVPEMTATRALGESPTTEALETMNLFVFNDDGTYLGQYPAQMTSITTNSNNTATAHYNAPNLTQTKQKRIVHFIAGNVVVGNISAADLEHEALDKVRATGGNEAYWQRVVFNDGFQPTANGKDIMAINKTVQLVRNFCELNLKADNYNKTYRIAETGSDTPTATVRILGSAVVNAISEAGVAPYHPNNREAANDGNFVSYSHFLQKLEAAEAEDRNRPYKVFYVASDRYNGFMVNDNLIETKVPEDADYTTGGKFVYARNQDQSRKQTYLLLKTAITDAGSQTAETYYYKIDMAAMDPDLQIVTVMNLYGNFKYTVNITEISGKGYRDAEDAMNAAAANNIAASIDVSTTTHISDGLGNSLSVEALNVMITKTEGYELTFEYKQANNATVEGVKAILYPEDYKLLTSADGVSLEVIDKGNGKGAVRLIPTTLPDELSIQEFILTTPSGLSRRIKVNVRKPFDFLATRSQRYVGKAANSSMSCIIALPPNLPVSMFPLEINVEPQKGVIYPDVSQNKLPVASSWKEFHYKVAVSYNDYRLNNFVNCFFKTNQEIAAKETDRVVIDVRCEHFNDSQMYFATNKEPRYFTNVSINDAETIRYEVGAPVVLNFTIDELPTEEASINMFTNYLEKPTILSEPQGSSGSKITLGRATQYIFEPAATGTYQIEFRTKYDVVGESLELTSSDMWYVPVLIPYHNTGVDVMCMWNGSQLRQGEIISIYRDPYYSEKTADLVIGEKLGVAQEDDLMHMVSLAGHTRSDILYFQYTDNSSGRATFYYAEAKASDLIEASIAGQNYRMEFRRN